MTDHLTTENTGKPIRFHGYRVCDECGFQFYAETADQVTCKLCDSVMGRVANQRLSGQTVEPRKWKRPPVDLPERKCGICGDAYTPKTFSAKFCSDACRWEAKKEYERNRRRTIERVNCAHCGKRFERTDHRKLCCSDQCTRDRKMDQAKERRKLAAMMAAASARKEQAA